MSEKNTKEIWIADGRAIIATGDATTMVAHTSIGGGSKAEQEATARRIASLPGLESTNRALVEALEGIVKWVDSGHDGWLENAQCDGHDFDPARAALESAKGQ